MDLYYLANKINKNANIKVKAEVIATGLQLHSLNDTKLSSSDGKVGVDQEITFFTSGFSVASGDKVTVNDTTTGTVASVSSDKKTVVVKFTGTGITAATILSSFVVVDKTSSNTSTVAGSTTVQP